jgi:hypothetical protein
VPEGRRTDGAQGEPQLTLEPLGQAPDRDAGSAVDDLVERDGNLLATVLVERQE